MALTQEAILNTLLESGGKLKNAELLSNFKESLNCSDPAEKKQNRDLFKAFVNNIAVVKEIENAKYIVLKKVYSHLLKARDYENSPREDYVEGELRPEEEETTQNAELALSRSSPKASDTTTPRSPIENALERSRSVDFKPKQFTVPLKSDPEAPKQNKPFALPLRMPQIEISHNKKPSPERLAVPDSIQELQSSPQFIRKPNTGFISSSPQVRRHFKTLKPASELKDLHHGLLDSIDHEWLVKTASGHWSQVYGLLLKDAQLAERKDFMSGFTALHWAVKCGNADMVCRIIELSRKGGHGVDVNEKSNGGYTPLHIAAIHNHLSIIDLLLHKYGANRNLRDNYGKKPYHYLQKGVSGQLRELLGDPKANIKEPPLQARDDSDPHKYLKGRLFPANPVLGMKKKTKGRFISMGEDGRGERDEPVPHRHRLTSNVFP
ncbi:ankyrin repeat domain-containing protein SOWAHB-like [Danio aesculapii]|uniref:ankyrin repeat domain-containing protein SOWAHB-like n=1 Tax=Danio aesculapii TaxID=1142201 RepID=UPI0024BF73FA|nr:ankyrin repeat domain-containing protein SOWAHB-like [Danio aesculapii]